MALKEERELEIKSFMWTQINSFSNNMGTWSVQNIIHTAGNFCLACSFGKAHVSDTQDVQISKQHVSEILYTAKRQWQAQIQRPN